MDGGFNLSITFGLQHLSLCIHIIPDLLYYYLLHHPHCNWTLIYIHGQKYTTTLSSMYFSIWPQWLLHLAGPLQVLCSWPTLIAADFLVFFSFLKFYYNGCRSVCLSLTVPSFYQWCPFQPFGTDCHWCQRKQPSLLQYFTSSDLQQMWNMWRILKRVRLYLSYLDHVIPNNIRI